MENDNFFQDIKAYYNLKLKMHGDTAQGVDWNSANGQEIRFNQLLKIVKNDHETFSINDLGCGYGALVDVLNQNYSNFRYLGVDVSSEMIAVAANRYKESENIRWLVSEKPDQIADYGVASGIFNVRLDKSDSEWLEYIESTLRALHETSKLGFAFNALTSFSDEEKKRANLFYANPFALFEFCRNSFSDNVNIIDNYGLYEFTILVRKN